MRWKEERLHDRIQLMWNLADSRLWLIDNWVIMGFQRMVHWWVLGQITSSFFKFVKINQIDKNAAKLFKFSPEKKNPEISQILREKKEKKNWKKKIHQSHTFVELNINQRGGKKKETWSQNFQPLMLVCCKTCFLPGNCRLYRWNATFAYVPFQNCSMIWWPAKASGSGSHYTSRTQK